MLFLLFSLSITPSHALQAEDVACEDAFVTFTSPTNQQQNVALDTVIAVGLSQGCNVAPNYTLTVASDGLEPQSVTLESEYGQVNLFEFEMTEPMQPNTEYTLQVVGEDGWGEMTSVAFTTGSDTVQGPSAGPSGTVLASNLRSDSGLLETTLSVTPGEDPDGLSVLFVYNVTAPDRVLHQIRDDEEGMSSQPLFHVTHMQAPFPEEVCFTVVQRDGLGRFSDPSDPFCGAIEITKAGQCSATSLAGLSGFLPLIALAVIRRRKVNTPMDMESVSQCS